MMNNVKRKCTKETSLNLKLHFAFDKCRNSSDFSLLHAWKSKLKGSNFFSMLNSNQSCHSFKEIIGWVMLDYSADICILQSINWMDKDVNVIDTNIDNDIGNVLNEIKVVCDCDIGLKCFIEYFNRHTIDL